MSWFLVVVFLILGSLMPLEAWVADGYWFFSTSYILDTLRKATESNISDLMKTLLQWGKSSRFQALTIWSGKGECFLLGPPLLTLCLKWCHTESAPSPWLSSMLALLTDFTSQSTISLFYFFIIRICGHQFDKKLKMGGYSIWLFQRAASDCLLHWMASAMLITSYYI